MRCFASTTPQLFYYPIVKLVFDNDGDTLILLILITSYLRKLGELYIMETVKLKREANLIYFYKTVYIILGYH